MTNKTLGKTLGIGLIIIAGLGWWSSHNSMKQYELTYANYLISHCTTKFLMDTNRTTDKIGEYCSDVYDERNKIIGKYYEQ